MLPICGFTNKWQTYAGGQQKIIPSNEKRYFPVKDIKIKFVAQF
jgi:hypothetical protein